jgi:hypothetical protein
LGRPGWGSVSREQTHLGDLAPLQADVLDVRVEHLRHSFVSYSDIHSVIHSFNQLFRHSFSHSFVGLFTQSLIRSLSFSFIHLAIHSLVHSFTFRLMFKYNRTNS